MFKDKKMIASKVDSLMKDGLLAHLLSEINQDLALEILGTSAEEGVKREDLYKLSKAVKCLEAKLQEYVNCVEDPFQENN